MERLTPFGKYYLLERINVGGMAEVFKAKTVGVEGFEKIVAIKRILPSVAEDEEFIKMFVDEAKITSQLSHANLAQTFDLGKIGDAYYIAMEFVPGKDLRAIQERLKRRGERVPINVAAYAVGRVCEGLDYAHRKKDAAGRPLNIVHRDVSPQNVIISFEGEVKLIDFGIAKAANKITRTQAGILKGKFGYMSPEQVRGLPLDRRSDIFAAGVVLYELCTGERLFTGSSDYSVLEKVQKAEIVPPSEVVHDMPARLEQVIMKALAREPEQRYQHAADLAQDLMRYLIESHTRVVSRDDVAGFMRSAFPDDGPRQSPLAGAQESTRTSSRRPEQMPLAPVEPKPGASGAALREAASDGTQEPKAALPNPQPRASRAPPSRLPASLTAGIDLAAEESVEITVPTPGRSAELVATDPGEGEEPESTPMPKPPPLSQQSARPPPSAAPARATPAAEPSRLASLAADDPDPTPGPRPARWTARDEDEKTEPGLFASPSDDEPTRPMSMDDLLAAERLMIERERELLKENEAAHVEITNPGAPPEMAEDTPTPRDRTSERLAELLAKPSLKPGPMQGARTESKPEPLPALAPPRSDRLTRTVRTVPPPVPPAKESLFATTDPGEGLPLDEPEDSVSGRSRRGLAPRPAAPRRALPPVAVPIADEQRRPYVARPPSSRPSFGDDEETRLGNARRDRRNRIFQIAAIAIGLGILGFIWLSIPHKKEDLAGPPVASLTVTTVPEDAIALLDGARVKESLDRDYTEPKMVPDQPHVLVLRREGFTEQTQTLTLHAGEKKVLQIKLEPLPGQLTVRSSPSGAKVSLDGVVVGQTPAYIPSVAQDQSHAIVIEKKCYHPWQVAIPAHAGKREVAATLEVLFGACPNIKVEKEEKTPELPVDDEKAMASLGFLSLGSRPSASVFIDGVDIGRTTPLVQWPLKVGKHKLKLVLGGKKRELVVEVKSGQTASEIVDLRKK